MRTVLALCLVALATPALAGPHCTDEPKASWMSEGEMREMIARMGYQVDVFKVTGGNCYEIYGRDGEGKRIEVYFHPVNGEVVKSSSI